MRNLIKNKSKMYVCNFVKECQYIGEDSYYTGETYNLYDAPKMFFSHISGAKGSSQSEIFGTDIRYDKTLVLTKLEFKKLGITENSVFFIEKKPKFEDKTPLYDYRVERIAETLNEVVIAVTKV